MGASRAACLVLTLWIALLLTGCVTMIDTEASQEQTGDEVAFIHPGGTVEQTFLARRPGLNGISLWVNADRDASQADGTLEIELFRAGESAAPVERFTLSLERVLAGAPVALTFPAQPGPGAQHYTIRATSRGITARFFGRQGDVHPYGEARLDGTRLEADLAFHLSYDYGFSAVLTDINRILKGLPLSLPLAVVLFLPGWLLLSVLIPKNNQDNHTSPSSDPGARFLLSAGLSMALAPLVLTWTTQLGLRWSRSAILTAAAGLGVLAAMRLLHVALKMRGAGPSRPGWVNSFVSFRPLRCLEPDLISFGLLGVFALTLFLRVAMARDLSAPPWVDSVHHGAITRRILDEGAFPSTYAPYIDIETANYHAGFHSLLAFFTALTGLEIDASMLVLGQVLNALAALGVYLFTTTLIGDRRAGLLAAFIAGLLTPMPAYYTSWGRYTQLAGLILFPAVLACLKYCLDLYERPPGPGAFETRMAAATAAAVIGGGLFLTHYRVAAFLLCLLAVYLPLRWWGYGPGQRRRRIGYDLTVLGSAALLGVLLTLPWWPDTLSGLFLPKIDQWSGVGDPFTGINWGLLTPVMGRAALVLAGAGLLLGLLQLRQFPLLLSLWTGLLFFLAYLGPLGLPGGGFLNGTSVEISLFIPTAASAGFFVSRIFGAWQRGLPERLLSLNRLAFTGAALVLALVAARLQLPLLRESTFLFRYADRPALSWVQEHLPPGATVLINPFAWGYNLYAGQDGGFWISPLAGLQTMPPPVLYGLADDFSTAREINATVEQAIREKDDPDALAALMRDRDIGYLYIGARGGIFSPSLLEKSGEFETLYAQDGVWVFQVR